MQPLVIILSGPGGAGKTTVMRLLTETSPQFVPITKLTTRAPREGESDGQEFHFISIPEFQALLNSGKLLESNLYNGNYYGVPKLDVGQALASGRCPVLVTEHNGARAIRQHYPTQSVLIFITAPEVVLLDRYLRRGQTNTEATARIQIAIREELPEARWYDSVIENIENEPQKTTKKVIDFIENFLPSQQ